ncbi:MAG: NVEALA domain-containing protein, partial [Tannerella sp.]|nr:NVEALA domain-containing protein [Tannerella sp.]
MNKILLSIFMVAVIAMVADWNVSRNMSKKALLSNMALANVEALATG